jgi:hypothetical protein
LGGQDKCSLVAIRDRLILDIACGSNSSRSPATGRRTVAFEPWMCRLFAALGGRPVGLDIGDLDREQFEHHQVDLGIPGALDFLPSASFDAFQEQAVRLARVPFRLRCRLRSGSR